jgi:hypothetical protein
MGLGIELNRTLHWVQAKQRHDAHAQPYMYIYLLTRRASMPVIDWLALEAAVGGPAAAHFVGQEPPLNQAILCHW